MTKVVAATEEEGRVPLVLAGSGEKKLIGKYWGGEVGRTSSSGGCSSRSLALHFEWKNEHVLD